MTQSMMVSITPVLPPDTCRLQVATENELFSSWQLYEILLKNLCELSVLIYSQTEFILFCFIIIIWKDF